MSSEATTPEKPKSQRPGQDPAFAPGPEGDPEPVGGDPPRAYREPAPPPSQDH